MLKRLALVLVAVGLALGVQAVPAAAPVGGALFGSGFPSTIVSIDPASGGVTSVASIAGVGPNASVLAMAADAKSASLDALVTTCTSCPNAKGGGGPVFFQIAVVNPTIGSISASPNLQRPIAQSIAVEPKTHAILGVIDCGFLSCTTSNVVLIDPMSGAETDIASLPVAAFFDTKVALAPKTHTLYVLQFSGQLYSVDTRTGAVTTGPTLGPDVTGIAVDAADGDVFVLKSNFQLQQLQVERIDPSTGQSTVLTTFAGFALTSPTIDAKSHTLFALGDVVVQTSTVEKVVSVNDRTGASSTGQPVSGGVASLAFLQA